MENKKYKVLGFMCIHYSGDYLKEALLSVMDHVDKMVISYSHKPSQGQGNGSPVPDSKEYIQGVCQEVLGNKLIWDEALSYNTEAAHRDVRYKYSEGFDVILTVDADEIMLDVPEAIQYIMNSGAQYAGVSGYVNFFRSFSWCALDGYRPIRLENLHVKTGFQDLNCPMIVLHFSCAQREAVMRYKYFNYGHASEIKPNYLDEIFYKWSPENNIQDLHPVAYDLWNAVFYDKTTMPEYLKNHPNYNKDLII